MKTLILSLICTFGTFAHAETHGGVRQANARFQSAYEYAQGEASDLERIHSIQRIKECKDEGTLYQVVFEGMDSNTGVISIDEKMTVKVTGDVWNTPVQAEVVSGCK